MKQLIFIFYITLTSLFASDWEVLETQTNNDLYDIEIVNNKIFITSVNGQILDSDIENLDWNIITTEMNSSPTLSMLDENKGIAYSLDMQSLKEMKLFKTDNGFDDIYDFYDMNNMISRNIKYFDDQNISIISNRLSGNQFDIIIQKIDIYGNLINEKEICKNCSQRKSLFIGDTIYIPTEQGKLFVSFDNGNEFDLLYSFDEKLRRIKKFNNKLFVWSNNKLFYSDMEGNNWIEVLIPNNQEIISNLFLTNNENAYLFTTKTTHTTIFKSKDLFNWTEVADFNVTIYDEMEVYKDSTLFLSCFNGKVLKGNVSNETSIYIRNLIEQIISINNQNILLEDFPIKMKNKVNFQIYDILGNLIYQKNNYNFNPLSLSIPKGVYIMSFNNTNEFYNQKFIIN